MDERKIFNFFLIRLKNISFEMAYFSISLIKHTLPVVVLIFFSFQFSLLLSVFCYFYRYSFFFVFIHFISENKCEAASNLSE